MMSDLEHLNMYFDDAMEEIDCHEVLNLWKNESKLTGISQSLKDAVCLYIIHIMWLTISKYVEVRYCIGYHFDEQTIGSPFRTFNFNTITYIPLF
jgi:hypothetical protein